MRTKGLPEYSNSQIESIISEYIHSDTIREVMELRLIDGLTLIETADKIDRPMSTVRDWYYKYLAVIKKALESHV